MALDNRDMERLKQMLLIALSSDQSGEVMSALAKVKQVLERAKLDYHWLADKLVSPVNSQRSNSHSYSPPPPPPPSKWSEIVADCIAHKHVIRNEREAEFVMSMQRHAKYSYWAPTERQEAWLMDIYHRFRV